MTNNGAGDKQGELELTADKRRAVFIYLLFIYSKCTLRMENYRFGYLAEFVNPQSYGSRVRVGMGSSCYKTNCSNSLGFKDI